MQLILKYNNSLYKSHDYFTSLDHKLAVTDTARTELFIRINRLSLYYEYIRDMITTN